MSTPEGKVKDQVKNLLRQQGAYWHCPVQNGMGSPALDFMHVIVRGRTCAIETKAPGGKLTPRQILTVSTIRSAGGTVFVIDGTNWKEFEEWLLSDQ